MMKEFRKRKGMKFYVWHFMPGCSNWPVWNYTSRTKTPIWGSQCDECQAKARRAK